MSLGSPARAFRAGEDSASRGERLGLIRTSLQEELHGGRRVVREHYSRHRGCTHAPRLDALLRRHVARIKAALEAAAQLYSGSAALGEQGRDALGALVDGFFHKNALDTDRNSRAHRAGMREGVGNQD